MEKVCHGYKIKTNKCCYTKQGKTKSGETSKNTCGASILENKEITVQPLATEATGKAKKYERTGPQEFVPFFYEEVTIPNVIAACIKHFRKRSKGMSCDVLASERGPSCSKISQLLNLKLIHVRFVMPDDDLMLCNEDSGTASSINSGVTSSPVRFGASVSDVCQCDLSQFIPCDIRRVPSVQNVN